MKKCNICHEAKSMSEFYQSKRNPDGRMYRCKQCDKKKCAKWQRETGYNKNGKRKDRHNPSRQAKGVVHNLVRRGIFPNIATLLCADCGNRAQEYHHWSYKKINFNSVIPLCIKCHHVRHNSGMGEYPPSLPNGDPLLL